MGDSPYKGAIPKEGFVLLSVFYSPVSSDVVLPGQGGIPPASGFLSSASFSEYDGIYSMLPLYL